MENALKYVNSSELRQRRMGVVMLQKELEKQDGELVNSRDIVAGLIPCLKDNNYKVSLGAMECLALVLIKSRDEVKPFTTQLLDSIMERMGDSKTPVRELAVDLLLKLMKTAGVTVVLDKLQGAAEHKNFKTRSEILKCVSKAIDLYLVADGELRKWGDKAIQLLDDSHQEVRESAMKLLEGLYKHFGPVFLSELETKRIRPGQLKQLAQRFTAIEHVPKERIATTSVRSTRSLRQPKIRSKASSSLSRTAPSSSSSAALGSERDLMREMTCIHTGLRDQKNWSKQLKALDRLGEIASAAQQYPCFVKILNDMRTELADQITNLRSAIVRSACRTVSELARVLADDFDSLAKHMMRPLLKLTMNSTSIMSTSGDECIRVVLQSTKDGYHGVISILLDACKNRTQRPFCVEYLSLVCQSWGNHQIERHVDQLVAILPSWLQDAQVSVRSSARTFYHVFIERFPAHQDRILGSIDATTQKHLSGSVSKAPTVESYSASSSSSASSVCSEESEPAEVVLSIESLLDAAQDSLWSTRMDVFHAIRKLVPSTSTQCEKLVKCFEFHLSDPHYKVILSVLENFDYLIEYCPKELETRLGSILNLLFHKLNDAKDQIQHEAKRILTGIRQRLDVNVVFHSIWARFDTFHVRIQSHAMEFIYLIIPSCFDYFENPTHMRQLIMKCSQWINEDIHIDYGQECLFLVYSSFQVQLQTTVRQISFDTIRNQLVRTLQQCIPEFEDHMCDQNCQNESREDNQEEEEEDAGPESSDGPEEEEESDKRDEVPLQQLVLQLDTKLPFEVRDTVLSQLFQTDFTKVSHDEWIRLYPSLLFRLLDEAGASNTSSENGRIKAIGVLGHLLHSVPSFISEYIGVVCTKILNECCAEAVLSHISLQMLRNEIVTIYPLPTLSYLIAYCRINQNEAIDDALVLITIAIESISSQIALMRYQDDLMKICVNLMENESTKVRRNAVLVIVKLFYTNKTSIEPYLMKLDALKRKLVLTYINKDEASSQLPVARVLY